MKVTKKQLKKQLIKTNKISCKSHTEKRLLDSMIKEIYNFHYSDRDLDEIIDSVDYGLSMISFEEFDTIMETEKEEIDFDEYEN